MKVDRDSLLLYAVTDRAWLRGDTLENQVEQSILGGTTFLQLREKNLGFDEFISEAKKIKRITDKYKIPYIINDNIDVALAVDADGVHVGQSDMNAKDVRRLIGNDKILGVSAQTVKQAKAAENAGADYLGVGAVFTTSTKRDADSVSFEALKEICESVNIPVVAIGGITAENAVLLKNAGIAGLSVISAIFASKDIKRASRRLLNISKEITGHYKAAIFDLDGTLLNSAVIWDNLPSLFLKSKSIDPPKNISEKVKEMSLRQAVEYLKDRFDINGSIQELMNDCNKIIENAYFNTLELMPYAGEYLKQLRRRGIKVCVATSSDKKHTLGALKRCGVGDIPEFIITDEDIGKGKQEPDIYIEAARRMNTDIGDCIVFEDALHAVKSAQKAGFAVYALENNSNISDRKEISETCDRYLSSFAEMLAGDEIV